MKLRTVRLRINPRAQPVTRRRRKKSRPAPARAARRPRTRRKARATGSRWVVELMQQKKSRVAFCYWDGHKITPARARAKKFTTAQGAMVVARQVIGKLESSYRLARAVPA